MTHPFLEGRPDQAHSLPLPTRYVHTSLVAADWQALARFYGEYHGRRFLNPGAAGCSQRPEAAYAIVDISDGRCEITERRMAYDRSALLARYDALEIPARDFIRKVFFGV